MNWEAIKDSWKQLTGSQGESWGVVADEPLDVIAGENDALSSEIQRAYGITKEEAETQVSAF